MFLFLLFGRGPRPRPNSKQKNTPPPKQQKKKKRPRPFRAFFFCCLGGWVCSFFCCLGGVFFFFFAVWAGACSCFCCLGGDVFSFLLFGPVACFFLLFGRGPGVHSLTRLPGSSLSDPTTKETEQKKKRTRVPIQDSMNATGLRGRGTPTLKMGGPQEVVSSKNLKPYLSRSLNSLTGVM